MIGYKLLCTETLHSESNAFYYSILYLLHEFAIWDRMNSGSGYKKLYPFFVLIQNKKWAHEKSENTIKNRLIFPFFPCPWKIKMAVGTGKWLFFRLLFLFMFPFLTTRIQAHFSNVHKHWKSDGTKVSFGTSFVLQSVTITDSMLFCNNLLLFIF